MNHNRGRKNLRWKYPTQPTATRWKTRLPKYHSEWVKNCKVGLPFYEVSHQVESSCSKWWISEDWLGYGMALQQQRSLAPMLDVGSFRSNPGHTRISWQTKTQQMKSPLNTTQRDTLARLHDENTHANCLPTSLMDHCVKQQVLVIASLWAKYTTLNAVLLPTMVNYT